MMLSQPIRVLVVDDSAFMRKAIREMLGQSPQIEVVGTAWSGQDALEKVDELHPDVLTIDLFMPEMDGVSLIRRLVEQKQARIVVCSSAVESGELVVAAMEAGAIEFVQKPTAMALDKMYHIQSELVQAVTAAAYASIERLAVPEIVAPMLPVLNMPTVVGSRRIDAVVLGISTGGPRALRAILPRFPADMPVPIVVVLHMAPGYTQALAQRLDESSQIEVVESADGVELLPGRVILAQGGINTLLLRRPDGKIVTRLAQRYDEQLYVPSVDRLFQSAGQLYGGRVLGVVMTGMGNDGTQGAAWIKSQGGLIIAEAESSSVVFGMPRAVIEAGLADRVVSLEQIPEAIMEEIL